LYHILIAIFVWVTILTILDTFDDIVYDTGLLNQDLLPLFLLLANDLLSLFIIDVFLPIFLTNRHLLSILLLNLPSKFMIMLL